MQTEKKKVSIHIGDIFASSRPAIIHTILGSCVAACLFDPVSRVGGMNHILLPGDNDAQRLSRCTRYGVTSMELLINKVLGKGGRLNRLVAKIFGGANVLSTISNLGAVGMKNAEFVVGFLKEKGIDIISRDLGGKDTRIIYFHTDTGVVKLKRRRSMHYKNIAAEEKRSFRLIKTALNLSEEKVKLDVLKELINMGAGQAARVLNTMLSSHIELNIPVVRCFLRYDEQEIYNEISKWCYSDMAVVSMDMAGTLSGDVQLVFSKASARKLAYSKFREFGGSNNDDALVEEALKEIGNIVINSLVGTLANELGVRIHFKVPAFRVEDSAKLAQVRRDVAVILTIIRFFSRELDITGNFLMTFKVDSFELLNKGIDNYLKKCNISV